MARSSLRTGLSKIQSPVEHEKISKSQPVYTVIFFMVPNIKFQICEILKELGWSCHYILTVKWIDGQTHEISIWEMCLTSGKNQNCLTEIFKYHIEMYQVSDICLTNFRHVSWTLWNNNTHKCWWWPRVISNCMMTTYKKASNRLISFKI